MNVKARVFVSLVLASLLLTACGAASPSSTVRKFYGYVQTENAEKALALFSTEFVALLGRTKLLAGLEEGIQDIKAKGGIKSVKVEEETIDGNSAEVSSVVKFGNGEESSDRSNLVKEDGGWKLAPSK